MTRRERENYEKGERERVMRRKRMMRRERENDDEREKVTRGGGRDK